MNQPLRSINLRATLASFAILSMSLSTIFFTETEAKASTTQDLAGVALDFNKVGPDFQPDGQSGPDFGQGIIAGNSVNFLDVGPNGLNAKVTYLTNTGVTSLDQLDFNDDDTGDNRMLNVNVDFDVAGSPAIDRYAELEIEFYRDIAQTYTPVTVSNMQLSAYDIDNLQFFTIDKAASYELSQYTVINDSRVGQSRWEFFSGDLSTSTSSTPGPTTRSAFSQGRVTLTMNGASKYTFRLGVSKLEPGTSGATFILDFGPGKPWGSRAGLDAPQVIQASTTPVMSDAVSFNPNSGTGTMPQQRATTSAALSTNTFARTGFNFNGWNTERDGTGTAYANGATFAFTAGTNVTELFAQWVAVQNTNVTFDANGGSGTMAIQTANSAAVLSANTLTRTGFTFAGWNTQANGSGTSYADVATFPFAVDTTLYAQWAAAITPPTSYDGPAFGALSINCIPAGQAVSVTLSGLRLDSITSASVAGQKIGVSALRPGSVRLDLPALAQGSYSIVYEYSILHSALQGKIVHQDSLRVCAASSGSNQLKPFSVSKRFTGYIGDRGPVVGKDLRAIRSFINANPGLTSVTCNGITSGVPARSTDTALATARAQNACRIVERLVPGVKTKITTTTGSGTGQFFRAVIISGEGAR